MSLRIFGAETCNKCKTLTNGLTIMGIPFQFVDAMADSEQALCDQNNVDSLPHIQLLSDDGSVRWEKAGGVTLTEIVTQLKL